MATATEQRSRSPAAARTTTLPAVCNCYDLLTVAPLCGITDFTDGKYVGDRNDRAAYLEAQERQAEFLLDQAGCKRGGRLLDIGCGYGRILERAERRGLRAIGITISPPQVADCRVRGLTAYELDYRQLLTNRERDWEDCFDAVIANGSLEHFVQATDAAAGRADAIYREMFHICRRLLKKRGRLVTTAIHFRRTRQFDPLEILQGPAAHPPRSPQRQFARLVKCFGGWYPEPGQLERCAVGYFERNHQEDGTRDYHLTSEYWLRQFKLKLATTPRVWWVVARQLWHRPYAAWQMLRLQLWDQSWYWQFRGSPPMQLLRQTWVAR